MKKKILILGAEGQLGVEFATDLTIHHIDFLAPKEKECDLTDHHQVVEVVDAYLPSVIINCAAYNAVDMAEETPEIAYQINSDVVASLAGICADRGIFLVHYSSDYVFDGEKQDYYIESDQTHPLNVYGKSKLKGEQVALEGLSKVLVFRLSWVIGKGKQNFLYKLSTWAKNNRCLRISADEVSVPTFTDDIVNLTMTCLDQGLTGLYHMTSSGYASRYELAKSFVEKAGLENLIIPVSMREFASVANRPAFSPMSNHKLSKTLGVSIPHWRQGIDRLISSHSHF